jgi:hypothetical protein
MNVSLEMNTMDQKFDLFRRLPDGHPIWLRAVDGLTEAKKQLSELAKTEPGDYFLYNSPSGQIIPFCEINV